MKKEIIWSKIFRTNSVLLYITLFLTIFFLTNHRQNKVDNYGCEICGDKAGYFSYLPATFFYGFNANSYPEQFDELHGNGFKLDYDKDRLVTKFTSGIAIMQAPFYSLGIVVSNMFSLNKDPYSSYYMVFINLGAAFWVVLGLFFFRRWLNYYVDEWSSLLTMLVVFFGTNLYYYTIDESLMSHLYSFTLFSIVLFSLHNFFRLRQTKFFVLFSLTLALAILVRPTNVLFVPIAVLLDVKNREILFSRVKLFFSVKRISILVVFLLVVFLPQLMYWIYTHGELLPWTYGDEGFTNWNNPHLAIVWFSPQSGLFPYTPLILLSLFSLGVMFKNKTGNASLIFGTFIVVSYILASWITPQFGFCNFGKRPMIEFFPILLLPLAYCFKHFMSFRKTMRFILVVSVLACVWYNISLTSVFNTCFWGGNWEWGKFFMMMDGQPPVI